MATKYLCATHGEVEPTTKKGKDTTRKEKRVSGTKATAAVLTAGISLAFGGLRSKKDAKATLLVCPQCGREVVGV